MGDLQALAEDLNEHLISMKDYQEEKIEILISGIVQFLDIFMHSISCTAQICVQTAKLIASSFHTVVTFLGLTDRPKI